MNKHKLNSDERLAAMQERIDRLSDRSALSGQIEACVKSRDDLADRLNEVIEERDALRGVLEEIHHVVIDLEPGSIAFYTRILEITKAFEKVR